MAAFAVAGNDLIVEHVVEFQSWYDDCVRLLNDFDVFYVGIHCPIKELERREKMRGDLFVVEPELVGHLYVSGDPQEGSRAFREKRPPKFSGQ